MASTFTYKVRDRQGKLVTGTLEADSQVAVVSKLKEMGYAPVLIQEQGASLGKKEIRLPWGKKSKVKLKHVAVMARQFATMVNSGMSLLRTLTILSKQTESPVLARVIEEVRLDVERGQSLSGAMAKHPAVFNRLFVAMIRSGETAGMLDSVLVRLAETFEKEVRLRHKIKSAMTYPVVVFFLVVLIAVAMLIFIVPTFKELYADLGGTLPLPTRGMIALSTFMRKTWWMFAIGSVGGTVGFKRWKATPRGRAIWDAFKLRVPIFGSLAHKTAMSRFSRTLSVLMRSGVPILQSLEIVKETVNNHVVERALEDVQASVKQGESIADPLDKHAIFPPMVVQMISVGEETGAVDTMLSKISDFYDQEVEATVEALTSLIEPIMVVVIGGAVGFMVVALYMPLFNIINLIK